MIKNDEKIVVSFRIDKELNENWKRVAKKLGMTKSAMFRQMLNEILPLLDVEDNNILLRNVLYKMSDTTKELGGLFDGSLQKDK